MLQSMSSPIMIGSLEARHLRSCLKHTRGWGQHLNRGTSHRRAARSPCIAGDERDGSTAPCRSEQMRELPAERLEGDPHLDLHRLRRDLHDVRDFDAAQVVLPPEDEDLPASWRELLHGSLEG